jgi:RNA polymerase sigma-70 factor (ECF subfamily)
MKGDAAEFNALRPQLLRVAYRMLGSMADAEDAVQEAWLRWSATDRNEIAAPEAFLRRVVTRLCLDHLKSARVRREEYFGPWLPDPVVEPEVVEDVTLPLMLALERLSPLERAAFLLHDVFGESFDEVAESLGREPAACRQLANRARDHVRAERPRFPVERSHGLEIAQAFFAASRGGEIGRLGQILADDVRLYSDGGGKRPAAARVMIGSGEVIRTFAAA